VGTAPSHGFSTVHCPCATRRREQVVKLGQTDAPALVSSHVPNPAAAPVIVVLPVVAFMLVVPTALASAAAIAAAAEPSDT
jgi:hypothetical protein